MTEIPRAPVTRILKEEGMERISKDAEQLALIAVEDYAHKLAGACADIAHHAGRKTLQVDDVELALKHFK